MILKTIDSKEFKELKFNGFEVYEITDSQGGISSIRIKDIDGKIIEIRKSNSYGDTLSFSIEMPKKKVEVFIVEGTSNNGLIEISKEFDTEEKAIGAISKEREVNNCELKITKIIKEI